MARKIFLNLPKIILMPVALLLVGLTLGCQKSGGTVKPTNQLVINTSSATLPPLVEVKQLIIEQASFIPSVVMVYQGSKVQLLIVSRDQEYQLDSPLFGSKKLIPPQKQETIVFTATNPGSFPIFGTATKSEEAKTFYGQIIVKPDSQQSSLVNEEFKSP